MFRILNGNFVGFGKLKSKSGIMLDGNFVDFGKLKGKSGIMT